MKTINKDFPEINLDKASREELIKYVNDYVEFYRFVDLKGHKEEQLKRIIERNCR